MPKTAPARATEIAAAALKLRSLCEEFATLNFCDSQALRWAQNASTVYYGAMQASRTADAAAAAREAQTRTASRAAKISAASGAARRADGRRGQEASGPFRTSECPAHHADTAPKLANGINWKLLEQECGRLGVDIGMGTHAATQLLEEESTLGPLEPTAALLAAFCSRTGASLDANGLPCISRPCLDHQPADLRSLYKQALRWSQNLASKQSDNDESMDDTSYRGSYGSYDDSEGVHGPVGPGAPANWCPPHLRPPGSRSRGPAAGAHMATSLAHDFLTETETQPGARRTASRAPGACDDCGGRPTPANPFITCASQDCPTSVHRACVPPPHTPGQWFCVRHGKSVPVPPGQVPP